MFYHHSSVIYFGKILHGRMQEIVTVYAKNCIGRCKISKCQICVYRFTTRTVRTKSKR